MIILFAKPNFEIKKKHDAHLYTGRKKRVSSVCMHTLESLRKTDAVTVESFFYNKVCSVLIMLV